MKACKCEAMQGRKTICFLNDSIWLEGPAPPRPRLLGFALNSIDSASIGLCNVTPFHENLELASLMCRMRPAIRPFGGRYNRCPSACVGTCWSLLSCERDPMQPWQWLGGTSA